MNQFLPLRTLFLFVIARCFLLSSAFAQETAEASPWLFLPESGPLLQLPSNPEEPRTGIRLEIGQSRMRLDVGANLDLLEFRSSTDSRFRLGLMIFAYSLVTNNQGLRLQIDALDGFFGGHVSYRAAADNHAFLVRLRILHRSAHFVDGHIDPTTGTWIDGHAPIPFTRDFGELVGACELGLSSGILKFYSGMSYATLVRPTEIERIAWLFGLDYHTSDSLATLFGRPLVFYGGYNLSLVGIPEYVGTNIVEGGVKFGRWDGQGFRIFVAYSSGLEVYGQYYNIRNRFWQIGFTLDIL